MPDTKPALLLFFASFQVAIAQNFIHNPGFEPIQREFAQEYEPDQHLTRSYARGCISCLHGWTNNAAAFADLNRTFLNRPPRAHPVRVFGESYAVITVSGNDPEGKARMIDTRSAYMTTKLKSPLRKGKRYRIGFQVALSRNLSNSSLNHLGILFSEKPLNLDSLDLLNMQPQILMRWVVDTSGEYVRVQDDFEAGSDFAFLTLGYFPDAENRKTLYRAPDLDGVQIDLAEYNKHPMARFCIDEVEVLELPDLITLQQTVSERIDVKNIQFETNQSTLTPAGLAELDKVAALLNEIPVLNLGIEGHTDNAGEPDFNMRLSVQRANAIVSYLEGQGIEARRLKASGYGETRPLVPNDSAEHRALNRRVVLKVSE